MTIFVDLTGRIGNQMFQYAFARKLQGDSTEKIVLNENFLKDKTAFKNDLYHYVLNDNITSSNRKLPYWVYRHNPFNRIMTKYFGVFQRKIKEKNNSLYWYGNTYEFYKVNRKKDIFISGYYQSEKYFEGMQSILRKEFIPREEVSKEASEFLKLIKKSSDSVCITVRRGNYVTNPKFKEKFYVANEDYFKKAILEIKRKVNEPTFFVFSDDLDWAKENINLFENGFVEPPGLTLGEKMLVMSHCNHFIISNSTFSWWAQYLGDSPNKIVISPKNWYVNGDRTDIYQASWIRV